MTTVTFEDDGKGTKVAVLWEHVEPSAAADFFAENLHFDQQGWSETFVRLQDTIDAMDPVA